jgi:hypothetical protein
LNSYRSASPIFFTDCQPNNTPVGSIPPASGCACHSGTAIADTGFYLGGSVGDTTLEAEFDDPIGDGTFTFDESDFSWDAEATLAGIEAGSDNGTDTAYGVGAAVELGSLQIRAEYEAFDISDIEDLYMLSAGFVFTF